MRQDNIFAKLCSSNEVLTNVEGQFVCADGPPMLVAIKLTFEPTMVILNAQADDSIEVITRGDLVDLPQSEVRRLIEVPPWRDAVSLPLLWVWRMINQQGYFDGIQFDFSQNVETTVARIQLLVVASEFKIQSCDKS